MRHRLVLCALFIAGPLSAQGNDALAYLSRQQDQTDSIFSAYRTTPYQPVRPGEVRSAGFLTEGRDLPFGRLLGAAEPADVPSTGNHALVLQGALIAVAAPDGATYQTGDTLLLAHVAAGPDGWGDIVVPVGIARVGDHTPRQTMARIIDVFGAIRAGDAVLPVEMVPSTSGETPADVSGPRGTVISSQQPHELAQVGDRLFIDMGRAAGLHIGDFVQVRRRPAPQLDAPDTIDELMATAQVVHVGDKSSTIKLIRVVDPEIHPGTPVVRTAAMP